MLPQKITYQDFHHPLLSGVVFAEKFFVFAIALRESDAFISRFEKLGINLFPGKVFAAEEIMEYLNGLRRAFSVVPKPLWGTPFQRRIWCETRCIPYSSVITYSELALRVGNPSAYRAVGQALAANPIPIIIPCHRIVPKIQSSSIGGFSGGAEIKAKLLQLEQNILSY